MNRNKWMTGLIVAISLWVGYTGLYKAIISPYFVIPRQDRRFLDTKPTESEILNRFGIPEEHIKAGERFESTGWHPLPEQSASHVGYSFVRRCGEKIYVYISTNKTLESYAIGNS